MSKVIIWTFGLLETKLWNSLSPHIKSCPNISMFKSNLKTHFFTLAFSSVWCTVYPFLLFLMVFFSYSVDFDLLWPTEFKYLMVRVSYFVCYFSLPVLWAYISVLPETLEDVSLFLGQYIQVCVWCSAIAEQRPLLAYSSTRLHKHSYTFNTPCRSFQSTFRRISHQQVK